MDYHTALAALEWQIELGADEALQDDPIDRFTLPDRLPKPQKPAAAKAKPDDTAPDLPSPAPAVDAVQEATRAAQGAPDLAALEQALRDFPHCELKKGARNTVFADGVAGAPVMIIGEGPGADEDRIGKPFVGRAGQLLDKMLAAISHRRDTNAYITNVVPWRPPGNRTPTPDEIAMMRPFLQRHIELAAPKILVVMGNAALRASLGREGITRARGHWETAFGLPCLPMLHPAYLLRQPHAKRQAWADLLALQARLREL